MGLRMESGSGRSQASEYPALTIPRCGPASPFKGQLSTKSNAFCIDSSQSLTNQYLIRDHMVFHYNKILSAKAAVDCSVPKSRLSSIKFADQQRREKLKKKIARCEEEMSVGKTASRTSSRESGRLLVSPFGKSFLEAEDKDGLFPCAWQAQYLSKALSPYSEHGLARSSPVTYARKGSRNTSNSSVSTSSTPRKRSGLSCSCSSDSSASISCSQRRQGSNPKARSGDLLDSHSKFFTHSRKPFTPHILISDAKSFLSGYRYYNSAQRKRKTENHCKQHVEAQTQTDVISFPSADKAFKREVVAEQKKGMSKAEDRRYTVHEPERIAAFPYSFLRETPLYSQQSSARRTIEAEEEFLYLAFIEEVTNEVLSLGLFSNRILEKLFECLIEENKNRLDESKMRHLLDVLKADLGCSPGSEAEHIHTGWEALDLLDLQEFDTVEELEIISKRQRQGKATKSDEFFGTMDLLKEPEKCESPTFRESSKETESKDDFSEDLTEMMDAGAVSGSCVKSEEDGGGLSSREPTLNLITCDSGLEANEEIDDLEESFAKALQISRDYM
ncbi:spermatogenesis-associated protein 7 isoform X1 [Melopsittacus undulatus]|uniref:Uncharacterized protein n=1 Tax=Melopsittacus undulatus TaxID=13146 RepID=A0A8V5FRU5_MELUD|nr:spermatogenesis-associated protein 7 isoform X1 [Melopsittacus undulatus]